ncbi:MAG: DUF5110 domain-containing protein, partial [Microscillaceae bacterium]|nr:DUF5110 domain-containing protein [Microscillaceae bacterium]
MILKAYTYLTGRMPLPPLWALGYQQCRYSYYPAQELLHLAQNFRERQIPADVLYLDIHYMEKYKVFTWDTTRFPDPAALLDQLREWGFKVVLIFDPGIKVEENYTPYEEGLANDSFVKYPDGTPYRGQVWPGWCHFPDFTKPEVREWWGTYFESLVQLGVLGFWNDMNEPAVWGKHFPDLTQFDWEGEGASHKQAHNVYGMQMARSTYEGVRKYLKNKRPFVLTRAAYAGIQRYSAVWTGDNVSEDQLMLSDVRIINSMGLSGLAFAGYDVGGFVGEANPALYSRWVALGAFSPFFRGHTMINSRDAEPWAFGEESEEIARNYIRLRYRLLPYLYSVFYEATQNGMPIQRSLVLNYPYEESTYTPEAQNLYFFGPAILVAPISSQQPIQKLFLPQGNWYNLFNDSPYEGPTYLYHETSLDTLPLFVKAGQMLWLQSVLNHTGEMPHPTLELHLYRGNTSDTFVYYEDDGETYEYEAGLYYARAVHYQPELQRLVFDSVEGGTVSKFSQLRIYWHGWTLDELAENLFLAETKLEVATEDYRFVEPISNFDPGNIMKT